MTLASSAGVSYSCSSFHRSVDGCIRTYDIRAGQLTTDKLPSRITLSSSRVVPVCSVALSRDNQCIVASTTSSTLVLFERKSGTLLNEWQLQKRVKNRYKGHVCEEFQIESVFNNTDEYLITGSENGNIVIYNLISVHDGDVGDD